MRELHAGCAQLVRRAILTIAALPDREARFHQYRNSMPEPVRDAADSYGYDAPKTRFRPTPRDVDRVLEVLSWLTWLETRNDGARDVKIIVARAFGAPWWKLAHRYGRSDDTMRRWEAGAIAAITMRFWRAIDRMTAGDSPS